jgi:hypothetical protein
MRSAARVRFVSQLLLVSLLALAGASPSPSRAMGAAQASATPPVGTSADSPERAVSALPIDIFAAVDLVGPFSLDQDSQNRWVPRSAEFSFSGAIDPMFDGALVFAGHTESDEFKFGLHEAYVGSTRLIPQSRFKLGKFLLGVGRLNQFHQHDWPFITAPKVHRQFFNAGAGVVQAEGAADSGVEYTWNLPTEVVVDLTLGVTNGYCFGHCHTEGQRPIHPLVYAHPTLFIENETSGGHLIGATYLRRSDSLGTVTELMGVDWTYKLREARRLKWLVQSEAYLQKRRRSGTDDVEQVGLYVYPQYAWDSTWSFGCRLDAFSELSLKFVSNGERRADLDYAIVPTLTYRSSEYLMFRVAYAHEVDTTEGVGDQRDRQFMLQAVYIMGAHPAHDF